MILTERVSYYGFPSHYYKVEYPNTGSKELSSKILDLLQKQGIKAEGVERGLDHGVFAPFKCSMSRNHYKRNQLLISHFL